MKPFIKKPVILSAGLLMAGAIGGYQAAHRSKRWLPQDQSVSVTRAGH
jgi:hypothetical protein